MGHVPFYLALLLGSMSAAACDYSCGGAASGGGASTAAQPSASASTGHDTPGGGGVFNCGAATFGSPSAGCNPGQVCCDWPSPEGGYYPGTGAWSTCHAPVTAAGQSGQCVAPAVQLCGLDSDCAPGWSCHRVKRYCLPPGESGDAPEAGTSNEGGVRDAGAPDARPGKGPKKTPAT